MFRDKKSENVTGNFFCPSKQEVPALPFDTSFWERNMPSVCGLIKLVGFSTFLSVAAAAGLVAYKKGLLPRS